MIRSSISGVVDDARIPLDDNATERGIRGPVVGRRNHFGSKSRRGTEVAATLYTVVETAKLHDIDPAAYIHAAIIAADRDELLLTWQREDLRPRCASRRPPTPSAAALRALIKHVQPVADYFVG